MKKQPSPAEIAHRQAESERRFDATLQGWLDQERIKTLDNETSAPPDLEKRLRAIQRELDALAREAHPRGFTILVNTHDGVIGYYNPRYPPLVPDTIRFITNEREADRLKR